MSQVIYFGQLLLGIGIVCTVIGLCLSRRLYRYITLAVVLVLAFLGYLPGGSHYPRYYHVFNMGVETFGPPIFSYRAEYLAATKASYSLVVYRLPWRVYDRFLTPDMYDRFHPDRPLLQFPVVTSRMLGWKASTWKEAPLDPRLAPHLNPIFSVLANSSDRAAAPELGKCLGALLDALHRKGCYYAFYYRPGDPTFLDFYLVDLTEYKLYLIKTNSRPPPP